MHYMVAMVALLFFASPAIAQKACTEMGCTNGLQLNADPSFNWQGGIYDISVQTETSTYKCRGTLPLKPCDGGPTFGCDSQNITIGESGCALPSTAHAISGIYLDTKPNRAHVVISRNGTPYITRTLSPDYQRLQPTGPGCGPVCHSASYDLLTAE